MLSVTCAGRRVTSRRIVGIRAATKGVEKERKARKGQGKSTKPKDGDAKQKGACHNCGEVVTLHVNVRRRKKQAMQVPVVEVVCIV